MALFAVTVPSDAFFGGEAYLMMGWDGSSGWWILMWVWMAAVWLLMLAGVMWLVSRAWQPGRAASAASEILSQRLARGEIDVEQYRALTRELGAGVPVRDGSSPRDHAVIAAVFGVGVLALLSVVAAVAAGRSDWDMFDHMGRMGNGGRDTANSPLTFGGKAVTVTIYDFAYSPGNLQVPVGSTVTWINRDSAPHDATSTDDSWRTETLSRDESASITLDTTGDYDYVCSIHPSMKAHLSVGGRDVQ